MELPGLTEGEIRDGATAESFRRGQEYYSAGAVLTIARRGDVVEAEVEGSQYEPYNVRVEFDAGGITGALCDCPYSWGGWCKHIVAVLLFCLDQPGEIEERPSLEKSLTDLDREQLQTLLLDLVQDEPRLANLVESRIALLTVVSSALPASEAGDAPEARRTPVDPKPFARWVHDAIRSVDYGQGWNSYSSQIMDAVAEVRRILVQARGFIEAGDGRSGLSILGAITQEYVAGWESLDDSMGDASGLFYDLGRAWTEALLSIDPTPDEKRDWIDRLENWQRELGDYGLDETLDPALEAAEQGWDFPPLQRILRDGVTEMADPEVEGALWDEDLVTARLNVLERLGRHEEFLNLARVAGHREQYVTMLVRLGRAEEAVEYGLSDLEEVDEALVLAKALHEQGHAERALEVAQHGLSLDGRKATLAAWLRDLAAGMGRTEQALAAARIAFEEDPDLPAYLRAQELAGDGWPDIRDDLLDQLRRVKSYDPEGPWISFSTRG